MYSETQEIHKQGFIEDTDVDQIGLMIADLETNLLYASNQIKLSKSYLKILLGIDVATEIKLIDKLDPLLANIQNPNLLTSDFLFSKHIDYRIMENQKALSGLSLKNEQAAYYPILSAFFTAQTNAMRNDYNFFDGSKPWYPTTLWGVEMNIPIFSSGSRSSKVRQAKLELKKVEELEAQLKNSLKTEEVNAKTNFKNSLLIHQNKKNSAKLALKIYEKTQLKYQEGVSSSMDLLLAYNQYLESEGNYIGSIVDLVTAKLALEKLFAE
jgi:outer membrane protein